jgi:hypothetical protein
MEAGVEGTLMDLEEVFRYLAQTLGDGVAVAGSQSDHLQDQKVQGAAEQFDLRIAHVDT